LYLCSQIFFQMNSWFTVKVKYTKQLENGTFKRVSEPYVLAAMTFTDAEARIYEELGSSIRGEFLVTGIARTDVHDIFQYDDTEAWYKCKVTYDKVDDEPDKKKTITQNFLVSADTVKEAYERVQESLGSLMIDFNITAVAASPIVEIFPYREEDVASPAKKVAQVIEEIYENPAPKGVVYSASGADEDGELEDISSDSVIEDNFSEEE
jgi:hypothetical protein